MHAHVESRRGDALEWKRQARITAFDQGAFGRPVGSGQIDVETILLRIDAGIDATVGIGPERDHAARLEHATCLLVEARQVEPVQGLRDADQIDTGRIER